MATNVSRPPHLPFPQKTHATLGAIGCSGDLLRRRFSGLSTVSFGNRRQTTSQESRIQIAKIM